MGYYRHPFKIKIKLETPGRRVRTWMLLKARPRNNIWYKCRFSGSPTYLWNQKEERKPSVVGLSFFILILFMYICVQREIQGRALPMLDKHSSIEPHPQHHILRKLVVPGTVSYLSDIYWFFLSYSFVGSIKPVNSWITLCITELW